MLALQLAQDPPNGNVDRLSGVGNTLTFFAFHGDPKYMNLLSTRIILSTLIAFGVGALPAVAGALAGTLKDAVDKIDSLGSYSTSADSKLVAYTESNGATGKITLHVIDMADRSDRPIETSADSPTWSHKGHMLLFYKGADLELWNEGAERTLSKGLGQAGSSFQARPDVHWNGDDQSVILFGPTNISKKVQASAPKLPADSPPSIDTIDSPALGTQDSVPVPVGPRYHPQDTPVGSSGLSGNPGTYAFAKLDAATGEITKIGDLHDFSVTFEGYAISPDSKHIAAWANARSMGWGCRMDLVSIPLGGGPERVLAKGVYRTVFTPPTWSQDSTHIAYEYTTVVDNYKFLRRIDLATVDISTGATTSTPNPVEKPAVAPEGARYWWRSDSKSLWVICLGKLCEVVPGSSVVRNMVSIPDSDISDILKDDVVSNSTTLVARRTPAIIDIYVLHQAKLNLRYSMSALGYGLSPANSFLLFGSLSPSRPSDLFSVHVTQDGEFDAKRESRLTNLNPTWQDLSACARLVHWRTHLGITAYALLRLPKATNAPMIVEGYPGSRLVPNRVFDLNDRTVGILTKGYAYLRLGLPLGPFSEKDPKIMQHIVNEVRSGVEAAIATGGIDGHRVGIMGQSFGGYMVNACLACTPDVFAAGVSSSGVCDLLPQYTNSINGGSWAESGQGRLGVDPWTNRKVYLDNSPIYRIQSIRAALLLLVGDQDPIVQPGQSQEMFWGLTRLGKTVRMATFKGEGHIISNPKAWETTMAWFDRWLRPTAK